MACNVACFVEELNHMNEIRKLLPAKEEPPTAVGKFLAKRGLLVIKQFREIGKIECNYGTTLVVSTLVLAVAKGSTGEQTFGLKFEHESQDGLQESCLVDFDELKELLLAIKHLISLSDKTETEEFDYTEFEYQTKDFLRVGFYQEPKGRQQAFFDVSPGGSMMFIGFGDLRRIFELIKRGREYLIEKGARSEDI